MIKVGIAGVGFMGWIHYLGYQQRDDIDLCSICTRNEQKLAGDCRASPSLSQPHRHSNARVPLFRMAHVVRMSPHVQNCSGRRVAI